MIELYKMVTGKYDTDASINFKFISYLGTQTRGNKYKIFQDHIKYNLRKYFFSNRVIQTWNSLPDFVVASGTINTFKNNLDKLWFNEEVKYNWKAELTGTGNRSLSCKLILFYSLV